MLKPQPVQAGRRIHAEAGETRRAARAAKLWEAANPREVRARRA